MVLIFAIAGSLVPGFDIETFWSAFWGAVVVSLTTVMVNIFLVRPKVTYTRVHPQSPPTAQKAKGGAKEYKGLFNLYQKDDHLYAAIKSSMARTFPRRRQRMRVPTKNVQRY